MSKQGQICLAFTISRFNVAPKTQPLVAATTEVRSVPLELDLLHLDKIECLFVRKVKDYHVRFHTNLCDI